MAPSFFLCTYFHCYKCKYKQFLFISKKSSIKNQHNLQSIALFFAKKMVCEPRQYTAVYCDSSSDGDKAAIWFFSDASSFFGSYLFELSSNHQKLEGTLSSENRIKPNLSGKNRKSGITELLITRETLSKNLKTLREIKTSEMKVDFFFCNLKGCFFLIFILLFSYMEKGVPIMEKKKPYGTVLIKAADILDFLSNHPDSILQEITEGTKMTPSTTLKILDTLVLIGYVNRKQDKSYRLGSKLIRYANQNLEQLDLVEITQPYLEKLQEQIDETIHLGILANQEILYVNKLEPKNQTIRMSSKIGITRPLYNSAMGKAVLAELSREEIDVYLQEHELIAYTEETITNPLKLKKELATVQQEKVAFDDEEVEKDIFCIGTAIVSENKVVGAFSISMPKYRMNNDLKERIIHEILSVKNSVENKLNH